MHLRSSRPAPMRTDWLSQLALASGLNPVGPPVKGGPFGSIPKPVSKTLNNAESNRSVAYRNPMRRRGTYTMRETDTRLAVYQTGSPAGNWAVRQVEQTGRGAAGRRLGQIAARMRRLMRFAATRVDQRRLCLLAPLPPAGIRQRLWLRAAGPCSCG